MKKEIKNGLFTSTQVSKLTGLNVQTLREWQRKKYIPLAETGGWQRYNFSDIFSVAAFKAILDTGLSYELASEIAKFGYPIFAVSMKMNSDSMNITKNTKKYGKNNPQTDINIPNLFLSTNSDFKSCLNLSCHFSALI